MSDLQQPTADMQAVAAPRGAAWTTDRIALRALLEQQHRDLGDLYSLAVDALGHDELTFPRLMVASHCLRELCAAIPRVLGDIVEGRADVSRAASELSQAWRDAGLDFMDAADTDETPRAVAASIYRAAGEVAAAAADGSRKSRALTALLATGRAIGLDDAPLRRLHKAVEFFRRWSHRTDYSMADRTPPTIERVEEELRILEDALLTRLGNIADRARELRSIIARANSRTSEDAQ